MLRSSDVRCVMGFSWLLDDVHQRHAFAARAPDTHGVCCCLMHTWCSFVHTAYIPERSSKRQEAEGTNTFFVLFGSLLVLCGSAGTTRRDTSKNSNDCCYKQRTRLLLMRVSPFACCRPFRPVSRGVECHTHVGHPATRADCRSQPYEYRGGETHRQRVALAVARELSGDLFMRSFFLFPFEIA